MNERNMEALAKMLGEHRVVRSLDDALSLAVFLTARGVLVPSALTEEEAKLLANPPAHQFVAGWTSTELERIAKGA